MPPIPDLDHLTPEDWDRLVAAVFGPPPDPEVAVFLEEQALEGQPLLEELRLPWP